MGLGKYWGIVRDAGRDWSDDKASMLGAALAYYTLFAIAPILVIAIAVAGLVFGAQAAQGEIMAQIQGLIGPQGARAVQTMLANTQQSGTGIVALVLGGAALLIGAGGAFLQLKQALDIVWEVERKGGGIMGIVMSRLLSFGMVLGIGFLLMVSLVLSAAISALQSQLNGALPGSAVVWQVVNVVISLVIITLLFGLIYKFLPDVKLAWRDVWIGAGITALLFTIGKYLIGLYLGHSSTASAFGAAGSLVILVVWIYYSAQIVLYGAEVTQVYATRYGSGIVPKKGAQRAGAEGAAYSPVERSGQPERRHHHRRQQDRRLAEAAG